MASIDGIAPILPSLRRFARAATGSQKSGDAYVASMLESILADRGVLADDLPLRVAVYRTFLKLLNSIALNRKLAYGSGVDAGNGDFDIVAPQAWQAFLLIAVERFSPQEAALILDISLAELDRLVNEVGRDVARQVAGDVLIIEDEPIIAMELTRLVTDLGHRVVEVARTKRQAIEAARRTGPDLILADIRLADGSSGISAVDAILKSFSVPVIFITAFPERLLTGADTEPTFLVPKPFHPDTVKALISRALFFSMSPVGAPALSEPEAESGAASGQRTDVGSYRA
jgi:CheY-like chemotaxis protein